MKLWGGRFTENVDELAQAFNASLPFDKRLAMEDLEGSLAHVKMLSKVGVLTEEEGRKIQEGLEGIRKDLQSGKLLIEGDAEDIHSFVETVLIQRIGELGKKLHTGRSRNDQVALDMRLYVRRNSEECRGYLEELLAVIEKLMEKHRRDIMPGFTHLQKAQPTTIAHHFGAYKEMFLRDRSRLLDGEKRMNFSPLGAGAFGGTTYPLDREMVAKELGFTAATENSMDSVSDRDYLIEYLFCLSMISMHLSRLCEEIILWNSNDYGYIRLSDKYSTGSSIMPQKKNPDMAELIRGKTGRVYGNLFSLLTTMKGLPLAYNKDMQEDKEGIFDSIDNIKLSIEIFYLMLDTITVNNEKIYTSMRAGFLNATDVADYLAKHNVPFRQAHKIVGEIVSYCEDKKIAIDDMKLEEFHKFSDVFKDDILSEITIENCVNNRNSFGGTSIKNVEMQIENGRKFLETL